MANTQMMTGPELAARTGWHESTIRKRRKEGRLGIEVIEIVAGVPCFDKDEAERWIRDNKKEAN